MRLLARTGAHKGFGLDVLLPLLHNVIEDVVLLADDLVVYDGFCFWIAKSRIICNVSRRKGITQGSEFMQTYLRDRGTLEESTYDEQ